MCACTVDNPLAKARGLSLRTGAQPMLYLPLNIQFQKISFTGNLVTANLHIIWAITHVLLKQYGKTDMHCYVMTIQNCK